MKFEDLKTAITDWLGKDSNQITNTVRGQLVNMAQRRLLRNYDMRFGEYTYDLSTADDDPDYPVPSGYSRTYSIWYMDGSSKVDLIPLTKEEFDTMFKANTTKDAPGYYTIWDSVLYLGPRPDAVYAIKWNLKRMLPDLADGSPNNENDVTDFAWEYLLFRSLHLATSYLLEDARQPVWQAEADRLEADLIREHSRERSTHRRPVTNEPG